MSSLAVAQQQAASPAVKEMRFHHIQLYADELKPIAEYKALEAEIGSFVSRSGFSSAREALQGSALAGQISSGIKAWAEMKGLDEEAVRTAGGDGYSSVGRDVVEQLISGLGFRVTASHAGGGTRSVLVTSRDPAGAKFLVTARDQDSDGMEPAAKKARSGGSSETKTSSTSDAASYPHFSAASLERFYSSHAGRQGIAVLSFEVEAGGVEKIRARYASAHPKLLVGDGKVKTYTSGAHILEVFAYYKGECKTSDADPGTIIRFIGGGGGGDSSSVSADTYGPPSPRAWPIPGMKEEKAEFESTSFPAYSDHWVSNVVSREGFLQTLEDTLGFTPKVDFNAGVVAAGEAQIESTVTGNTSGFETKDKAVALVNQSQVYLPINNALSPVGHVSFFLEEIGQGIQHVASRVPDLIAFIARVNAMRKMTGRGFSFLRIPRSYYGRLTASSLIADCSLSDANANAAIASLRAAGVCDGQGVVELDIAESKVKAALEGIAGATSDAVVAAVLRGRYNNIYKLLGSNLDDATYVAIVRNEILVDIQDGDILYQIFTSTVLQRQAGQEAPFFEFIQRVCQECKDGSDVCKPIRPGCGGFGIRNFLTLFLSIEVSKAMRELDAAEAKGDAAAAAIASRQVELLTEQLDVSNPVLTDISDAMTAEGNAQRELQAMEKGTDAFAATEARMLKHAALKEAGNKRLQDISAKYAGLMRELRLRKAAAAEGEGAESKASKCG